MDSAWKQEPIRFTYDPGLPPQVVEGAPLVRYQDPVTFEPLAAKATVERRTITLEFFHWQKGVGLRLTAREELTNPPYGKEICTLYERTVYDHELVKAAKQRDAEHYVLAMDLMRGLGNGEITGETAKTLAWHLFWILFIKHRDKHLWKHFPDVEKMLAS